MAGSIHKYETKKGEKRFMVMLEVGDNGKRKQKKKMGFKTKTEARKFLTENEVAVNNGTYIETTRLKYGDFIEDWFLIKNFREQTVALTRRTIDKWITPYLGDFQLSNILPTTLERYVNLLKDQGLAPATIRRIFVLVRGSLEHAVDLEILNRNPASKTKLPHIEKNEEYIWTEEEANRFFLFAKDVNPSFYIAYYIAYFSGARQGEILGLPWKNVDFENNAIKINQTLINNGKNISPTTKNKASKRTIGLPAFVLDRLKLHKEFIEKQKKELNKSYIDNDLVCCTSIGTPIAPTDVRKRMNKIAQAAKIPHMKFHGFRHLHTSTLLQNGINIKKISSRLGHTSPNITLDVYSHITETMEIQVIESLEDITKTH